MTDIVGESRDQDPGTVSIPDLEAKVDRRQLRERVQFERMRQYMRRERLTAASGALPSAYLVWLHWPRVDHTTLIVWWLLLLVVDMASVAHTSHYLAKSLPSEQLGNWRRRQLNLQFFVGLIWGSFMWLCQEDTTGHEVRGMVLVAVNAIAVIGMLPYRHAVISFSLALWIPPLLAFVTIGGFREWQLALGIVVLMISLNFYLWEASKQLIRGIERRFEAEVLVEMLRAAALRIHELATRDELTGIFNRREGMNALNRTAERRRSNDTGGLSLIMIDIDHFKRVNDTHGHAAGDEVLREVTRRLQRGMRESEVLARIGGEEFMVVLPNTPGDQAEHAANRLRESVAAQPINLGTVLLPVTLSLGIAELKPGESPDMTLRRADDALYQAKRSGRNRAVRAG